MEQLAHHEIMSNKHCRRSVEGDLHLVVLVCSASQQTAVANAVLLLTRKESVTSAIIHSLELVASSFIVLSSTHNGSMSHRNYEQMMNDVLTT